jgi:Spy/CpxP family protein refolding chaperone
MKRALIITGLLVSSAVFAQAQPMMPTPAERAARLKERLALTEEQTKKVEEIFQKSQEKTRERMAELRGDREAMRALIMEQTQATDKGIEKVLNEEQRKKYEELKKERRQRRRGGQ